MTEAYSVLGCISVEYANLHSCEGACLSLFVRKKGGLFADVRIWLM